jgi:transposase
VSGITYPEGTYLGLDVSKDSISVGILEPGREIPVVDKIFHDEASVRRLIERFGDRGRLRVCYEAGPTGYELARLLQTMGVACQVVAPSLIPVTPGQRIKTDRRDARRLARLYRAGELTPIRLPSRDEEAVRDLCRARGRLISDRDRARRRVVALLLRHGRVYRDGTTWTDKHHRWLAAQTFDQPALQSTLDAYRAEVTARQAAVSAIDAQLRPWADRPPFAEGITRLIAYRGIAHIAALTITTEVCDWARFPTAGRFMGFVGLVPCEYSSGGLTHRGRLTKAGNEHVRTQLIESAWAYRHRPAISLELRRRQQGCGPHTLARSWKAQQRLWQRWCALRVRHKPSTTSAAAIARELAGFVWAEMTATEVP